MTNHAVYGDLTKLKALIGDTGTSLDSRLLEALEDASDFANHWCGRHFSVRTATCAFSPVANDKLLLPVGHDLLSITTLKSDEDDDFDYDYTWATTDYHLLPLNTWPKWEIKVKPDGDRSFPIGDATVQIVGQWGYGDGESATPYVDSGIDTAEVLDASETGVDVATGGGASFAVGQTILIESEQMYITGKSIDTLTVVREVNGTTAATHATGKDIYVYQYPRGIVRACLRLANRLYQLESAPFGVRGSADMGTLELIARRDPEILDRLDQFKLLRAG